MAWFRQTRERRLTRSDVLAYFEADYRQRALVDPEVDPDEPFGPDMTIWEWKELCDLVSWPQLGDYLNATFAIDIDRAEWGRFIARDPAPTLGDMSDLIADRATIPSIEAIGFGGAACDHGGVFLALREILRRQGLDVSSLRPSTSLDACLDRFSYKFIDAVHLLLPKSSPIYELVPNYKVKRSKLHRTLEQVMRLICIGSFVLVPIWFGYVVLSKLVTELVTPTIGYIFVGAFLAGFGSLIAWARYYPEDVACRADGPSTLAELIREHAARQS
jgi:hypothetical protein